MPVFISTPAAVAMPVPWEPTVDGVPLVLCHNYVQQDGHVTPLPPITAAIDGQDITLYSPDWEASTLTGIEWVEQGTDVGPLGPTNPTGEVKLVANFGAPSFWSVQVATDDGGGGAADGTAFQETSDGTQIDALGALIPNGATIISFKDAAGVYVNSSPINIQLHTDVFGDPI